MKGRLRQAEPFGPGGVGGVGEAPLAGTGARREGRSAPR